jgi:hypothetical protein
MVKSEIPPCGDVFLARIAMVALLCMLLAPGFASAHEGHGVPHVNPVPVQLEAGQTWRSELQFIEGNGSGDFERNAIFLLSIVAPASGSLDAALHKGHEDALGPAAARWTVCCAGQTIILGTVLPEDGRYTLALRNNGSQNATTLFFYDQSCNCAGKPIPAEVAQGAVIFNADAHLAGWLNATIFEPPALRAKIRVGTFPAQGSWPQDFREVARSDAGQPVAGAQSRAHSFNLTTQPGTRFYFVTEGISADAGRIDPRNPAGSLMLTPLFEEGRAVQGAGKALGSAEAALFLPVAGLALALRRLR